MRAIRVPPGRTGRLRLAHRLATAERGREQLDRKLRLLLSERDRQYIRAARHHNDWLAACADAQKWALRAGVLGGQDAIRHASPLGLADVELTWVSQMGLRYPAGATVEIPVDAAHVVCDNAAVPTAVSCSRRALEAGVLSAAADEAVRRLEAEVALTRRRLRALDKGWIPALRQALQALELSLEQAEQEDQARLRRAGAGGGQPSSPG